ncbi:Hsp20/alpha crystallin family protein [Candidatus Micrarchaeota archaeon]|nr:Hsp20/alpha crystallin family protein [Candidatus Micrarchaeota archaeon]
MVKKRRRMFSDDDPFGFEDLFESLDADFGSVFESMRKQMDELHKQRLEPGKPLVYGFSMRVGPDGKPHVEQFGNVQQGKIKNEREPLVDVVNAAHEVRVVVELPGVEKKDIHMNSEKGVLHIDVGDAERAFTKDVHLPEGTVEKSAKASYKNGILEVLFQKKGGKKKSEISVT